ncbi:MAG: phytanoyl-CoA dioxygenase family protein [Gemmatimonadaceae bacterium]|nr:phytanoyl-CoA dioxygenase family protein [Gemmatimonadaceae bacterium]
MTAEQLEEFRTHGVIALRQELRKDQYEPVRQHVLSELKRLKVWSGGKASQGAMKGVPMFQQVTRLSQSIRYDGLRERIVSADLLHRMQQLAGNSRLSAQEPQLLVSPPNQGEWSFDGLNWHTDITPPADGRLPGVQVFALLDDVAPKGGGTLVVAGSQGVKRGSGTAYGILHDVLRQGDAVPDRLTALGYSLVEMSGRAGDVYLMDLRLLHSPSVNSLSRPRIMATSRYFVA